MVKVLDDNADDGPDHIGWRLWQASRLWQEDFVAAMGAAGHGWMTDARATLLGHIGRNGTPQSRLIARMGISKQAVQQLVDGLEGEGILCRVPAPNDKRARIIAHTPKGRAALRDADRIKLEIEERYRRALGEEQLSALKAALAWLSRETGGKNPARRG
ncbi:MarR family winged helix-turn-helix transcriptional regulator [Nitratireductor soli]|uniref:MarR family winged helix-turn-helix transcriptional regulator n=1 Tax=Nitratireductor soli TaxID=1670619 RepID=UPI00065E8192|nr:MarR family winged helix-turn-helix transcriptional regulator [Nitratireductor soli]